MPRPLQAVLILVQVLLVATIVGGIDVLSVAASVDAVDGHLIGMLLYAALPGITGFVLSLYARTGGVGIWRGLLAVHAWFMLGALATLSGEAGLQGLTRLVIPAVVVVLLTRAEVRAWFRLGKEERAEHRPFSIARMVKARRDSGQSALEYLGMVLVVVALVGAITATGIGGSVSGRLQSAICELAGGSCSAPGTGVEAGGGSGSGGNQGGEGSASGGAGSEGSTVTGGMNGGTDTGGSDASGGSDAGGSAASGGSGSGGSGGAGGSGGSGGTGGAGGTGGSSGTEGSAASGGGDSATPVDAGRSNGGGGNGPGNGSGGGSEGGFIDGFLGDGLGGDVSGVIDAVLNPVESGKGIADQWTKDAQGASDKWDRGDFIGAVRDVNKAVGGGGGGMGLPGSGGRVDAEVKEAERGFLNDRIPENATAAQRKSWWDGLSEEQRERYIELSPDRIGNLDGIPVAARDAANRKNLQDLIGKLEKTDTEKAKKQLAGLKEIDRQLKEKQQPPMYLIGIGDEGNGRAIVSYGNPDTSKNVSAYVPGLNTSLDEEFAKNDLGRARDTAIGAQGYDESTASIVWLGYDAPQLPDSDGVGGYFAVMGSGRAEKGGAAYSDFMGGIAATNQNKDPHVTAIGHSYGSRTVGAATQREGGIPGVDDIILVGSPGVGVDHAVDLGVGSGHVFVGAARNDPVTKLPSKTQVAVGAIGLITGGPGISYLAGDLADPGDDDLWFGKDPASKAFGAHRFPVDDGPAVISGSGVSLDAHSQYFDPERDAVSADSIALIVSGHSDRLKMEEQR
ncbi:alpha/beta hydrolase [Streptomyces sp. TE33382]